MAAAIPVPSIQFKTALMNGWVQVASTSAPYRANWKDGMPSPAATRVSLPALPSSTYAAVPGSMPNHDAAAYSPTGSAVKPADHR